MPQSKDAEKASQRAARRAGIPHGAEDRDEKQLAGRVPPEATQTKSAGVVEVQEGEGPRRSNDTRMANMERRMDDMCVLLERLMAVRTAEQYYMATGGTLMLIGMAGRYGYQEPALYSTPSGAYHDQTLYLGEMGDTPEDSHSVWPSNKETTH
ncbi:hypothetical protein LPJ73_006138 [Coemansia sp. RSA 2703]|nr:hypothetical protein LPJ73_006138 [Coemansia sp. RSA 2703]KAJ2390655.1 hypothetical protein GGI05_003161 [Coemansia sp. RSA 2603]